MENPQHNFGLYKVLGIAYANEHLMKNKLRSSEILDLKLLLE